MTQTTWKAAKCGTVVMWDNDPRELGKVVPTGIHWADGQWTDRRDDAAMRHVSEAPAGFGFEFPTVEGKS